MRSLTQRSVARSRFLRYRSRNRLSANSSLSKVRNNATRVRRIKEIKSVVRQNDEGLIFQEVLVVGKFASYSDFSRSDPKLPHQRLQGRVRNTRLKFLD